MKRFFVLILMASILVGMIGGDGGILLHAEAVSTNNGLLSMLNIAGNRCSECKAKLADCELCGGSGECSTCNPSGKHICPECNGDPSCTSCTDGICSNCEGDGYCYQIDSVAVGESVEHEEFLDVWRESHPDRVVRIVIRSQYDEVSGYLIAHHQKV